MAAKLYSASLPIVTEELKNPATRGSLVAIGKFLGLRKLVLRQYSDELIAISVKIKVELPPLGNFQDIDIRPEEPVLILFDVKNYPSVPPIVKTDRLDFPKDALAHLYVAVKGKTPAFCMVRGDMADWYAKKKPQDLIIRIGNWLRDAANGELTLNGGRFDPMRYEAYSGKLVYDYDQFAALVQKNQSLPGEANFAMAIFKRTSSSTYQVHKIVSAENAADTIKLLADAFKKEDDGVKTTHYHIGYIAWSASEENIATYQIEAPNNWQQLVTYAAKYGIDLESLGRYIAVDDRSHFRGIVVVIGIKRPAQVIGFSSSIEFSNHVIVVEDADKAGGKLNEEVAVLQYIHNQPLTLQLAQKISGVEFIPPGINLAVGCGALGSKILSHLGRSGYVNFIVIDKEKLSAHNLARHALFADHIGRNKAEALAEEIKKLYPANSILMTGLSSHIDPTMSDEVSNGFKWIFDFTASESFFNTLVKADKLTSPNICRVLISDHGQMGVTMLEGANRNPRIDDLQISVVAAYKSNPWVTDWLNREADQSQSKDVELNIGVGCNSETTVIADDLISLHASYASIVIKKEMENTEHSGKIFLSRVGQEGLPLIQTDFISIKPFVLYHTVNESIWEIRYMKTVIDTMKSQMGLKMPNETGGVLIGSVNYSTHTIHVMDIITEPADSASTDVYFLRGIEDLPEQVLEITQNTGGQLGYVGEWHSHPFGPNKLSSTDMRSVMSFKKDFEIQEIPLPVFLTVVTPDLLLPYVF
jgi:proteasome lid subunit RPN8/RPN11